MNNAVMTHVLVQPHGERMGTARGPQTQTSAFDAPSLRDWSGENFSPLFALCRTYTHREASIIQARSPATVAAIGITTAAACCLAGKRHGPLFFLCSLSQQ